MFKKILQHKFITGIILLLIIAGGYFGYQWLFGNKSITQYVTAQVQKGALIVSISGSGQVSASNQVDVKPKTNGEIIGVYVKQGQEVGTGALLATIDARNAERAARDAETSLETAKLELDKILEPLDELTLLQAENSLTQTKESKQKAEDNLKKAYDDGFNTVANTFLDIPGVITGLHDMLFESTLGWQGQWNINYYADSVKAYDDKALQYKEDTRAAYQMARAAYDKNFANYKSTSRFADRDTIESLRLLERRTTRQKILPIFWRSGRCRSRMDSINSCFQFCRDSDECFIIHNTLGVRRVSRNRDYIRLLPGAESGIIKSN